MFCPNCGKEVEKDITVCPVCGNSLNIVVDLDKSTQGTPLNEENKSNGMAIAGFVCSFFIPILGWVFGGIGISKSKKKQGKGLGFSIAALIIATFMFFVYLGM